MSSLSSNIGSSSCFSAAGSRQQLNDALCAKSRVRAIDRFVRHVFSGGRATEQPGNKRHARTHMRIIRALCSPAQSLQMFVCVCLLCVHACVFFSRIHLPVKIIPCEYKYIYIYIYVVHSTEPLQSSVNRMLRMRRAFWQMIVLASNFVSVCWVCCAVFRVGSFVFVSIWRLPAQCLCSTARSSALMLLDGCLVVPDHRSSRFVFACVRRSVWWLMKTKKKSTDPKTEHAHEYVLCVCVCGM